MLEGFDFDDFWEDSDYARESYVEEPLTPELVRSSASSAFGYRPLMSRS